MRIALIICLAAAALAVYIVVDFSNVMAWTITAQRGFQNEMATAVRALKTGESGAYFALLSATAAYGFVHALGPGHGKYLVGGVGMGTSISTTRLLGLAVASSLTQALWAITLVYGGFFLIEAGAHQITALAEDVLAPVSYIAIACVGVAFIWRGIRSIRPAAMRNAQAKSDCGCHSHGPTAEEAAQINSFRDAAALIISIAIRPCTGAIFLLVIAWQMDLQIAGAAAVLTMGLGTAALTGLVAASSTTMRQFAVGTSASFQGLELALPSIQILIGVMVVFFSLGLLGFIVR